ncbi:diguanylate cyclase [Pseudomonas oryzihabitans]|nr:diguanylate cyclase [Pseudomonas psychrotolerans]KTT22474.1 diguanylate cyclase [Pseudomonas psychrotolerans]KTT51472.1 diguanylate cyclase [Pseudomonas psychrotolerans]
MAEGPGTPAPTHNLATRRRALALLVCAVAVVFALEAWQVWRNYENAFANARSDVSNIALAAAQHANDAFREADLLLVSVRDIVESQPLDQLSRPRIQRLLERQVALLPQLYGLFIYDRSGNWLVTDKTSTPPPTDSTDRDYFRFHQQHMEDVMHVGPVIKSHGSGEWVIPVSRRLDDAEGRFAGVILATIRLQYFVDYYARFQLDNRGAIALVTNSGTLVVRRPFEHVGLSLTAGELYREHIAKTASGTAMTPSLIDGQKRLYAFQHLDSAPLIALAGISESTILVGWRQGMLRSIVVVGILIVGMLIFGLSLLREIRTSLRHEAELRRAHDDLQVLTLKDSLTGLANRRHFDTLLPAELARAQRTGQPLSLLMLDIDHFKAYNDHYGHPAGDRCLQAVAGVVAAAARRPGDLAVRYGGEEMALLLPNCDEAGAFAVASGIQEHLGILELPHPTSSWGRITLSLGFAIHVPGQRQPLAASLLASADEALYTAKHLGRNRIHPQLCALSEPEGLQRD